VVTGQTSFSSVIDAEFIRVDRCSNDQGQVSCNSRLEMFVNRAGAGLDVKEIVLITGIVLLIVAIIVGISIGIYIRRWRKKNDLELLGYPPKVPPPRSNLSAMSRSNNSSVAFSVRK